MTTAAAKLRPLVLGNDLRRFWELTLTLAATDFKLRFYGSALGYAWTLVRPFAFFGVIWFVFAEIVGAGANVKNYPSYILMSMTLFQYFLGVSSDSLGSLVDRQTLLRKIRFPRLVIPLAVTLQNLFNLALTLVAVWIFLAISGVYPTWRWLELLPLVGLLTLLGTGAGLLLSVLYVRYRDLRPIWDVFGQMLFYASPVLYVATIVPDKYLRAYMCNPLATILSQMRHAVVDSSAPSAISLLGGTGRLLIPGAIIACVFVVGICVFVREAPRVAENV